MCRFKFAVPIVGDMRDLRYRRLQYDNADSEFGDLKKPNINQNHALNAWYALALQGHNTGLCLKAH